TMAKITIPTPLRKFTNQEKTFESNADNVDAAIKELVETYPDIKGQLLDAEGNLRSFIKVFVGDEDIKDLEQGNTALKSETTVSIVPAIAGGKN
ncbi:MAG: MoaD/ThiS family protein, partial [Chitinophagales bacterium]